MIWLKMATWSHATLVSLLALLVIGAAICFKPKRRNRRLKAQPFVETDYTVKRARALQQLGDDYLCAKPINRLPALMRPQAGDSQ